MSVKSVLSRLASLAGRVRSARGCFEGRRIEDVLEPFQLARVVICTLDPHPDIDGARAIFNSSRRVGRASDEVGDVSNEGDLSSTGEGG